MTPNKVRFIRGNGQLYPGPQRVQPDEALLIKSAFYWSRATVWKCFKWADTVLMGWFSVPVSDKRNRKICEWEQLYWELRWINVHWHFTVFKARQKANLFIKHNSYTRQFKSISISLKDGSFKYGQGTWEHLNLVECRSDLISNWIFWMCLLGFVKRPFHGWLDYRVSVLSKSLVLVWLKQSSVFILVSCKYP